MLYDYLVNQQQQQLKYSILLPLRIYRADIYARMNIYTYLYKYVYSSFGCSLKHIMEEKENLATSRKVLAKLSVALGWLTVVIYIYLCKLLTHFTTFVPLLLPLLLHVIAVLLLNRDRRRNKILISFSFKSHCHHLQRTFEKKRWVVPEISVSLSVKQSEPRDKSQVAHLRSYRYLCVAVANHTLAAASHYRALPSSL